jgi:hypothetical protein
MKEQMEAISQRKLRELGKHDYEMPFTKIEGFLKEFPWITKYISRANIRQVYASRITPEIMSDNLSECGYAGEQVFLLDAIGYVVNHVEKREVVIPAHSRRKFFFFGPVMYIPDERVRITDTYQGRNTEYHSHIKDILDDLKNDANKVSFVVSYFRLTQAVIIYKVPKGITLSVWIKQQIEAEQAGFKQECEAIDAEAVAK